MVNHTYRKNCRKRPENAGENQNVINKNRSGENPQEISEVELWLMLNEGRVAKETSNDPRQNSPFDSEESTYCSCPDSTEEDDAIGENRSGENPQKISEVELWLMLNEGRVAKETSNDPRQNSPFDSEESTYCSCPDSTEEDDAIGENRSGENPQEISEVELWLMLNEGRVAKETSNDPRQNSPFDSEGSSYFSCPETTEENVPRPKSPSNSDQHHYPLPTKNQKQIFFEILKDLLRHQSLLKLSDKHERQCGGDRLELMYMVETCELAIWNSDGDRRWRRVIKTKDIYLEWRGSHVEPLSRVNIQKVQNELEFLGVSNYRVQSCFNLAQTEFAEEPSYIRNNMKLDIICDEVIITFSEGQGENVAVVHFDNNLRSPRYNIDVNDWWLRIKRFFHAWMRWIGRLADNASSISSKMDTLLTCIIAFFQNIFFKPKSQ